MTITPLLNPLGHISNFIAIKQDISERKSLEAQLLRTQRLESVGRLASGIAHDLNNILTPALMGPPVLREALTDPVAIDIVDSIESSAQRGASIIKQLLMFGRGMQGERMPIQLRSLVREMIKIMEETFPKNIEPRFVMPSELQLVNAAPTQIHQVLMNLCLNARDSMPFGGKIVLAVQETEIDEALAQVHADAKPGSYVMLSITDTGSGIAPEHLDKIFDPFFTTKPIGEGTGLGLSSVLGIVRGHGGFIEVDSNLGKGTQFRIYLPTCESIRPLAPPAQRESLPQGNGETILVVDDEPNIRRVASRTLVQNGYQVLEANQGLEALELLRSGKESIQVVLTDLMMPVMDGPSLIFEIRRMKSPVKIITISGYLSQADIIQAVEADCDAFLAKPFTAVSLLKTLKSVLSR